MWWRMWRRQNRSLEDFQAEIESHLAIEADEIRDSESHTDPEAAARRAFGNVLATQEKWYERRRWMPFDHLKRDLRQAFRQFRTRPGFCAIVILTLGLGIGANSAIFSIINAVLLRPLPYRDPGRLAMVFSGDPARELHEGRVSLLNFVDWRSQNRSFDDLTMFNGQTFLLGTDGPPERMRSARVMANLWPLLGVKPLLGRVFSADEEKRGDRVVVLSFGLWQQRFGGSKEAIGSHLRMDDRIYQVIGVMPATFHFPFPDTRVWEPVTAHPYWTGRDRRSPRTTSVWFALGRLRRGVTWTAAQHDMDAVAARLRSQYSENEIAPAIEIVPLDLQTTGRFRPSLWLLLGAVFLMLLIACINVAGLLLARGSSRQREFAVRRALGAGRLRIASQVVVETLVLSVIGGVVGTLLASGGIAAIQKFGPQDIPRLAEAHIDWTVIAFTAAVTILAGIGASLGPALGMTRSQVTSRQWKGISARRSAGVLVIGEFALALVLVTSATLLINSFLRVRAVELGFHPDHLLSMRVDLHVGKTSEQQAAYFEQAIQSVEAVPGVESAAAISDFLRTDPEDSVQIEGRAMQHPGPCQDLITGPFFKTAGIPLRKGRIFSDQDRRGTLPVAIINETMARAYWPGEDPVGKRFRFRESTPWLTVVGVTGDMRRQGVDQQVAPQVFAPHRQWDENMMDIIVRTTSNPAAMAQVIQQQIQSIDKTVAKFKVATVVDELGDETSERRFDTFLVASFAIAALLLSAIGIYGLLHHVVSQRTNEIGVRMALGARPGSVMALVLRQGLTLSIIGSALGAAGALFVSRLLSKLLYQVAPNDPVTFAISITVLLGIACVACFAPSLRASRIDPVTALRQE